MTTELQAKKTIVAVPSLSLVKQTLEVYLREVVASKRSVKWLCICSDEGIGKDDDVVYFTENIGVPCQTDPKYIKRWLEENRDEEIFIFTTYQSGRIIADISKQLAITFDLGIFDEAHKTVGANKKLFSHLLFEENISISKRIFMTATERFYKGSKDDIISMDDEDIYGDTFAQMSFKEAIETGLLTDYKVITIEIQKSEIAEFIRENNLVQLNDKWKKETEARSMASMLALRKAMKMFPIKNAVSFHSSIEKAVRNKELQQYITDTYDYQPIDTFTVSGKQATSKRNSIVQEFARSEHSLITNARCLTEGVDVPNIDCIIFSDPRKSKVDIVQALGRALRKKEGKDWGYVILPIIYDDTTQEIDNDNFQEILSIVRGLASNDERIVEFFKDKEQTNNKKEAKEGQFHLEVFSDYMDASDLASQLQIKLWEKLSRFSWMPFEEAREYIQKMNFTSQNEFWFAHKKGEIIKSIPYYAHNIYKYDGFTTYADFLGYSGLFRERLSYSEARIKVAELGIKSTVQWREATQKKRIPNEIPYRPDAYYLNDGWINWKHWFNKVGPNEFYSFIEARNRIQKLNLGSVKEWKEFIEENYNHYQFPKTPDQFYKNKGWISWGDFLGTYYLAPKHRNYLSFLEAKIIVHKLKLKSQKEWLEFCKNSDFPTDIPKSPAVIYKGKGWVNMYDWLGVKSRWVIDKEFLGYEEAIDFVKNLGLKNWNDWRYYIKDENFPDFLPKQPNKYYKNNGWVNWGEWLGNGKVATKELDFLPYEEAREFVRKLGFKNTNEWRHYCRNRSLNIPSNPERVYKDKGWVNFADFIGTNNIRNKDKKILTFLESLVFSRSLGLKNEKEWRAWKRQHEVPENIPPKPEIYYKESGWMGYSYWLQNSYKISNSKKSFLSFEEAKAYAKQNNIQTRKEYKKIQSTEENQKILPSNPDKSYSERGWKGWADFLGKE
jgi:superfamily II DNA or RNA helicase